MKMYWFLENLEVIKMTDGKESDVEIHVGSIIFFVVYWIIYGADVLWPATVNDMMVRIVVTAFWSIVAAILLAVILFAGFVFVKAIAGDD